MEQFLKSLFCCVSLCFILSARGQTPGRTIVHTVTGEAYVFELLNKHGYGGNIYVNYCGQTARYTIEKAFSGQFSIGAGTGVFFHVRNGEKRKTFHSYVPLQATMRVANKNQRFAISLSIGYPFMLTSKDNYMGSGGLWYKNVWHNPVIGQNDGRFFDAQSWIIDRLRLLANLRLAFALSPKNNWYLNTCLQCHWFSSHAYQGGTWFGEYVLLKGRSLNLSMGISYRFGHRKTEW